MHLAGMTLKEIGERFGVSKERARQMVIVAKAQLAFRVFKGLSRPRFYKSWWETANENTDTEAI